LAGTKYASLEGGGGMKGLRTNEVGFGKAFGTRGASVVLLNAAMRSRKDDIPSLLVWVGGELGEV
jgi:hypothetical protein